MQIQIILTQQEQDFLKALPEGSEAVINGYTFKSIPIMHINPIYRDTFKGQIEVSTFQRNLGNFILSKISTLITLE